MSFKIFSLQLLGKIKPVETIESKRKSLKEDFEEFHTVEGSEELKLYQELESFVSSDTFKKKKAEVEALGFKGSVEEKQLKELDKLKKSKQIRNYFKTASSAELKRFEKLEGAEQLKEYNELLTYIKDGEFEQEKNAIKSEVFKGSEEEKKLLGFKKLDKSKAIKTYLELHNSELLKKHEAFGKSEKLKSFEQLRNAPANDKENAKKLKILKRDNEIKKYFRFEKSKKLLMYRETIDSLDLKQYYELKEYVEKDEFKKREAFLKDKKKFEKSEAYKKLQRYKTLVSSDDIKFYLKFKKSSLYKNYLDVGGSTLLKRYNELVEIVDSKEFKERKAYLEDRKKWEKTEEFARQQKFLEMKKYPHLVKYYSYKGSNAFDFLKNWEVSFEDNFDGKNLESKKWSVKSFLADKLLGENYSMAGDLHVLTDGANLAVNNKLTIQVKKEKSNTKIWKMPAGFVPAELEYTSGMVSSWNSFWQEDGIFEAKIKFSPQKEIVSSFYLAGEENSPRVHLLEMGTKNRLGVSSMGESGKIQMDGLDISNLKKEQYYIFSVEKSGGTFTWKINEKEVFSMEHGKMNKKLHLNASSIVVYDVSASKLPSSFEIDWVRCYRKK